jgi:hypothetical protein
MVLLRLRASTRRNTHATTGTITYTDICKASAARILIAIVPLQCCVLHTAMVRESEGVALVPY